MSAIDLEDIMTERTGIEIHIAIDESGNWQAGETAEDAVGNLDCPAATRTISFLVSLPLPEVKEVDVVIPDEPNGDVKVTVS